MTAQLLALPQHVRLVPASDAAVLVEVAAQRSAAALEGVHALFFALTEARPAWILDVHPAYTSLLIEFDPLRASHADVGAHLATLPARVERSAAPRTHVIGVRYGGPHADLDDVARALDLTPREVIARHTGAPLSVAFLGFMPGFAYLEGLDRTLAVPRRASPRARVPRGSVAIAAGQAAVYPQEGPGGWQILGVTDVDVTALAFELGDVVRFTEAP